MRFLRFATLIAFCALFAAPAFADGVDDFLAKFIVDKGVPGLQIGIYKDGKPVKVKGYGFTKLLDGLPVDERTLFNIGSVTKQFTSAAILLLADGGKLSVEDGIRKHLPELPEAFEPIKLKHVLGHIGGFGDYDSVEGFSFEKQMSESEFLAALDKSKPLFAPGEKYQYSNIGYCLLGIVIHRASGKPYEEFVSERIFRKLGMDATSFIQPGGWPAGSATGFNLKDGKPIAGPLARPKVAAPSGAILTNGVDMAKWDAALRGESLLKKESKDAAWTAMTLNDGKSTDYGYGWSVLTNARGIRFVLHTGATVAGFRAAIIRQVNGPYSAVVFANLGADLGLVKLLDDAVNLWKAEFDKLGQIPEPRQQAHQRVLNAPLAHVFP